jgi:diguanylate cyclase (GGDEF)-like protein
VPGEKILIVDDDHRNVEFLRDSLLSPSGYTTLSAIDGNEALRLASMHEPDLILLDLQMPKMDGFEVLEALHKAGHEIPTILITAHGSENVAVQAFRLGVRDYFLKPFKVGEIMGAVERCLREARLRREKGELTRRIELANRQLEQRLRELNILYGVSKSVTSLLEPDRVLTRIVEATSYITGADEISLFLLDEDAQHVQVKAIQRSEDESAHQVQIEADDAVVRQVMDTGEVVMIQSPRSRKTDPLETTLAVPLRVGERTTGVLRATARAAAKPFSEDDRYLLSMLADYGAIAIENARLYEAAQYELEERKRAEAIVRQMAYHDDLTGLPNRALFNDRLGVALARARRSKQKLAVMLLDLDHFKDVNDTLGHAVGDQLLQAVGQRLSGLLRESDTVCRMGGDEFLLLLPDMQKSEYAGKAAERILEVIRKPFTLGEHRLPVTTSLGIAVYPDDGEDGDALVKNADLAMYVAKDKGRDRFQSYDSLDQQSRRPRTERQIRRGESDDRQD